jgi:cytochrome c oxidase subunit 2
MEEMMRIRPLRPLAGWALVVVLVVLLGGCAINGDDGSTPLDYLAPAPGTVAEQQDALWNLVFPIAVVVFVLVQGLVIYTVFRFRQRRGDDDRELPKQVAGNTRLEIAWTIIPAVILVFVAVPTVRTIFTLSAEGPDPLNVRVIGKQYWWEFEYEDPEQQGVVTATQLHIPTGREIQLDMQAVSSTTSYDPAAVPEGDVNPRGPVALGVIHSFWVPKLAGKQDIVPGHTREMAIRAETEGVYLGQCAEFCGLSHPNMRFSVVAESPEEFDAWIAAQAAEAEVVQPGDSVEGQRGDPAAGQELFTSATCVACHAIEGYPVNGDPAGEAVPLEQQARVGPNLTHFNSRDEFAGGILEVQSDDDLRAWLANPQALKPGAQMPNLQLSDEQIDDLVAYLRTLD